MNSHCYRLPWPPSINHYWKNFVPKGGKRAITYISAEGKAFRAAVLAECRPSQPLTGRLAVHLELVAPNRLAKDIDNRIKATLDALQHAGVYRDDSQIDELIVSRRPIEKPGCCDVTIVEL